MVWIIITSLYAGYGLIDIIKELATHAPASAELWKNLPADMENGFSFPESWENTQQAVPSENLYEIVAAIQKRMAPADRLASLLEPLMNEFWEKIGTDGAFDEFMRDTAKQVGAQLPPRLKK
jgi:hypothetical protein